MGKSVANADQISAVILDLYQGTQVWTQSNFQNRALERVKTLIPFDSAMWGAGANNPNVINNVYLYRQPRKMMEEYTQYYQDHDFLRAEVCARPGTTINLNDLMARKEFERSRIYREFSSRYGIENVLSTALIEPLSTLFGFISLWRSRGNNPFNEKERQTKQVLMPHLLEAYRLNRLFMMRLAIQAGNGAPFAAAICDRLGILHQVEGNFFTLLRTEWPKWGSARLPAMLQEFVSNDKTDELIRKNVVFRRSTLQDLVLLEARKKHPTDRLGQRERAVAEHYAQGKTNAEVAKILGVSTSTVRNQLSRIYRKLGINDKATLARKLQSI